MRCWTTTIGHATDRRDDRVVEHRIINNGDGGWRVRCDEAWGEGNGTDDWPAMHGAYWTGHHHRHRHRDGVSNKTPPPTELQIPATVTTLVIAVATNFGTKIAITGFMRTTATRQLVMEGVWVVGRENVDIASTLHNAPTGHCHGNHFLAFYIWGAHQRHLANMTVTICVWQWCGLMSNYFELTTCFIWCYRLLRCFSWWQCQAFIHWLWWLWVLFLPLNMLVSYILYFD